MLDHYVQHLDTLRAKAQSTERLMRDLGEDDLATAGRQVAARIQRRSFQIALVGEFKAGKSTLANCLLGDEILPSATRECTATVTRVRHKPGATPSVQVTLLDGSVLDGGLDQLDELLTVDSERPAASGLITLPHCDWLPEGVELVDTPGLGAAGLEREVITLRYLPTADAIVFVTRADQLLTEREQRFLAESVSPDDRRRLFVAVNFGDRIQTPAERDDVRQRLCAALPREIPNERLFIVSAADAIDALLDDEPDDLAQSGILSFRNAVRDYLVNERAADELQRYTQLVTELLQAVQHRMGERRALLRLDRGTLERRRERIGELIDLLRSDATALEQNVDRQLGHGRNEARVAAQRAKDAVHSSLTSTTDKRRAEQVVDRELASAMREIRSAYHNTVRSVQTAVQHALSATFDTIDQYLEDDFAPDASPHGAALVHQREVTIWEDDPNAPTTHRSQASSDSVAMGAALGGIVGAVLFGPVGAAVGAALGAGMTQHDVPQRALARAKRQRTVTKLDAERSAAGVYAELTLRVDKTHTALTTQFHQDIQSVVRSKVEELQQRAENIDTTLNESHDPIEAALHAAEKTLSTLAS